VLSDLWIDQLSEVSLQPFMRPLLIRVHQARVARDVGGEDPGETTGGGHLSGKPMLRSPTFSVFSQSAQC